MQRHSGILYKTQIPLEPEGVLFQYLEVMIGICFL